MSPAPLLSRAVRLALVLLEIALLSALILVTRCANLRDIFVGGQVYFVDADCYSRMSRARLVAAHPGLIVRHQDYENYPAGTTPHTTAPLDYLIAGLAALLRPFSRQPLDLAGAFISPLLALGVGWFLCWWSRRMRLRFRWAGLLLFALSPILVHGTALGRPDHQGLLIFLLLVALAAEWTLQENASRGWGMVSGVSWGLALWVSLYEPALLLGIVLLTGGSKLWRAERRAGWLGCGGVLLIAALVERRWPVFPGAQMQAFYLRWSSTIGELSFVGLTNRIWLQWFGGFILLAPLLLVLTVKRKELPLAFLALVMITFGLTLWQARWAYFFALVLCLTIPILLASVRTKWLALALAALAFFPIFRSWDATLWPNQQTQTEREARRLEMVQWRAAASALAGPFLAPWWLAPSASYWSGQPAVAGSSHESLPGIVASARVFLSTEPAAVQAMLRRHGVRWVLAYDGERTVQNSAALLGLPASPHSLGLLLDRAPAQVPAFLSLVGENGAAKLFRVQP